MKKNIFKRIGLTLLSGLAILGATSCNDNYLIEENATKITVAASPAPHAEILEQCIPLMSELGYTLEVKEFTEYVLPNIATEEGEVQANYFQHTPYLDEFNANNGTHLVSVAKIHYEPFGLYAGEKTSLSDVSSGDKIIIPNDGTNEARALFLLEQEGLIELKDGVGLTATKLDIEDSKGLEIVEAEAAAIYDLRDSAAFIVLNGNYAIQNGLKVNQALATESSTSEAAQLYANILCVREGNENHPIVLALKDCLLSETIKNFIETKYEGSVVSIN